MPDLFAKQCVERREGSNPLSSANMSKIKYTKEFLEPLVKQSKSYSDLLRKLNLRVTGGSFKNIKKRIIEANLDTSHFESTRKNCSSFRRKKSSEILVLDRHNNRREPAYLLRRSLDEIGRDYKCESCDLRDCWNHKPLKLEIDHINGNSVDNRAENLRYLCPNCHSQTATYYQTKAVKVKKKLGRERKVVRPEKELLAKMVWEQPTTKIAKLYNVSDKAVEKWCKEYGISKPPRGFWAKRELVNPSALHAEDVRSVT